MSIPSRRLGLRHLLAGWGAYWSGLAIATLSPAAAAIARLSGPSSKGSATLSYGDGVFKGEVLEAGRAVWSGVATPGEVAFWVAVPPLLIFALWLWARRDASPGPQLARPTQPSALDGRAGTPELGAGVAPAAPIVRGTPLEAHALEERRTPSDGSRR